MTKRLDHKTQVALRTSSGILIAKFWLATDAIRAAEFFAGSDAWATDAYTVTFPDGSVHTYPVKVAA